MLHLLVCGCCGGIISFFTLVQYDIIVFLVQSSLHPLFSSILSPRCPALALRYLWDEITTQVFGEAKTAGIETARKRRLNEDREEINDEVYRATLCSPMQQLLYRDPFSVKNVDTGDTVSVDSFPLPDDWSIVL